MVNPLIVLIPGAWLAPAAYNNYTAALNNAGYATHTITYPSFNAKNPSSIQVQEDFNAIKSSLEPMVEQGENIVMVMHSYGGMPGAAAAYGFSTTTRKRQNKPGGILGLIFAASFLIPQGQTCAGFLGGALPPWVLLNDPSQYLCLPQNPGSVFAADWTSAQQTALANNVFPHAQNAFFTDEPAPAFADPDFAGRLAYQETLQDQAIPVQYQQQMISATGKTFIVDTIDGSHMSPFGGKTLAKSVSQLDEIVKKFQQKKGHGGY